MASDASELDIDPREAYTDWLDDCFDEAEYDEGHVSFTRRSGDVFSFQPEEWDEEN